jgi:hypothetical protein
MRAKASLLLSRVLMIWLWSAAESLGARLPPDRSLKTVSGLYGREASGNFAGSSCKAGQAGAQISEVMIRAGVKALNENVPLDIALPILSEEDIVIRIYRAMRAAQTRPAISRRLRSSRRSQRLTENELSYFSRL